MGRRPELQQALRALRSGERAGVLLHGQGRLGKSSLAARIADRCPDLAVAVVFGDYSALAILDAIAAAVRANPAARQLIEARLPRGAAAARSGRGGAGRSAGRAVRPGRRGGQRPLLLIIDDLEQILVPDPAGPHRVAPGACAGAGGGAAGVRPGRDRQPAAGHQPVHLHAGRAGGPAGAGAAAAAVGGGAAQAAAPAAGADPRRSGWPSGPGWRPGRWRSAGATPACRT